MIDPHIKALLEIQKELSEGLVRNPVPTMEAYYKVVGEWQGIQLALDTFANNSKDDN